MVKYCRDCLYFKEKDKIEESICKAPQNVDEDLGDPYGYGGTAEFQPRVLNMKNKCKYYKGKMPKTPRKINRLRRFERGGISFWPLFKKKK